MMRQSFSTYTNWLLCALFAIGLLPTRPSVAAANGQAELDALIAALQDVERLSSRFVLHGDWKCVESVGGVPRPERAGRSIIAIGPTAAVASMTFFRGMPYQQIEHVVSADQYRQLIRDQGNDIVAVDPEMTPERARQACVEAWGGSPLSWPTLGLPAPLSEFVAANSPRVGRASPDGEVELVCETAEWGIVACRFRREGGPATFKSVRVSKTKAHRLSPRSERRLGDVKRWRLLDGAGLEQVDVEYTLTFERSNAGAQILKSGQEKDYARDDKQEYSFVCDVRVTSFETGDVVSDERVSALATPIADGTPVGSGHASLKGVDLAWVDGRAVRRVDGKAVTMLENTEFQPDPSNRFPAAWWAVIVITGIAVAGWLCWRVRRRS